MKARGVALLMGLVLLAAISLLAVMATNGMVLQQRMASNFDDRGLALENAQLAAAAARAWLDSRADFEREAACATGCLLAPAIHGVGELPPDPEFESSEWWRSNAVLTGTHPESGAALGAFGSDGSAAYWLVEELHFEPLALAVPGPAVASGAVFDMHDFTCAHRTFPFGTWLRITNIVNKKSTFCMVNDRGPFEAVRDLDLSYAAATMLDMISLGICSVRIEYLGMDPSHIKTLKAFFHDRLFMKSLHQK